MIDVTIEAGVVSLEPAGSASSEKSLDPIEAVTESGASYRGHAFISYTREDSANVYALQHALEAAGIPVWRNTLPDTLPGEEWRTTIRQAITDDALAFTACFSRHNAGRRRSNQNEELLMAIDQLRRRCRDARAVR